MLRLMEIVLPGPQAEKVERLLAQEDVEAIWRSEVNRNELVLKVLVAAEKAEPVMDLVEKMFGASEGFRLVLLPVEAALPRPAAAEEKDEEAQPDVSKKKLRRISREELYSDLATGTEANPTFFAMVVLSSVVAAVGLMRDNVAVVIGAMVVAPLLKPNAALALASTLGDLELGRKAMKANLQGISVAFPLSVLVGVLFEIDPSIPEILSRTNVGSADIVLALAAGAAGALAFTSGVADAVIGVMVAVALLPPLVTLGMLLGSGHYSLAAGAFLLLAANVICVNLAGVTTFLAQGVRPRTWWEADRARKATRKAIALWTAALAVLAVVLYLAQATWD